MHDFMNLFYPWINEPGSPRHNQLPDESIFLLDGEESILCFNCNKQSNKYYRESLCQIEFPDPNIEYSIQMKIEEMTNNPYGEEMNMLYKCENCRPAKPDGTKATRALTLMNVTKYLITQLKTKSLESLLKQFQHFKLKK